MALITKSFRDLTQLSITKFGVTYKLEKSTFQTNIAQSYQLKSVD